MSSPSLGTVSPELRNWCAINNIAPEIEEKLAVEEVTDPQELAVLTDEDLAAFSAGLRLGQKGKFLTAIRRLRIDMGMMPG